MTYDPHQGPPTRSFYPEQQYSPQPPAQPYPISGAPTSPPGLYGQQYPPQSAIPQSPAVYQQQPMYQQVVMAPSAPTSGWATASMVLGIVGALGGWCMLGIPCLVAVIAGHVALGETKDGSKGGRGLAVTGLVLGYVFVVPWALFFLLGGIGAAGSMVSPTPTPAP